MLDGIITVVDAKHIEQHLDEKKPEGAENEAVEQLAFADRVLLNKIDLVTKGDIARVEGRIRSINKFAPIQHCQRSAVSVESVLNIKGFDLKRTLEMDPAFLNEDEEHGHDQTVTSLSIVLPGMLDLEDVRIWMETIRKTKGADIFRMKGILSIASSDKKFVYQGVHMIFTGEFGSVWDHGEERVSKMVFIGKNLDHEELRKGFAACIYSEERAKQKVESLRFQVGDQVECNFSGTWCAAKVLKRMFEVRMPNGMGTIAPYMVRIENGPRMLIRKDSEETIRKPSKPALNAAQQQQIKDLQAKQEQAVAEGDYHKAYLLKTQIDQLKSGEATAASAAGPSSDADVTPE